MIPPTGEWFPCASYPIRGKGQPDAPAAEGGGRRPGVERVDPKLEGTVICGRPLHCKGEVGRCTTSRDGAIQANGTLPKFAAVHSSVHTHFNKEAEATKGF